MSFTSKFLLLITVCYASVATAKSGKIVYMLEDSGGKHIYQANADGTERTAITSGTDWHLYPDIAADGSQVVYVAGKSATSLAVISKDLHTGAEEQWTAENTLNLHPDYSGDGRFLAFSGPLGAEGAARIGIIDLRGARKSAPSHASQTREERIVYDVKPVVIPSEYVSYFPALSSDGSFVVFQRNISPTQKDIVLYDMASAELTLMSDPAAVSMAPALSFDDRLIAYTAKVEENWDVYVKDRLSGKSMRVTTDLAQDFAPAFRPDGGIVFASNRSGHFELYEISAASLHEQEFRAVPFITGQGDHYAPSLSGTVSATQSLLPAIPEPARSSFGAIQVGSRIYIVGGHQGPEHTYPPESFLDKVQYYDLTDGQWHDGASRSQPCHGFGLAAFGKYIYAFGGFAYSAQHKPRWHSLDIIERYDMVLDKWEMVGTLPRRRSSNVVAQVGSKVYLIGGWDSTPKFENDYEGTFHRQIDVFDLQTETVSTLAEGIPDPLRRAFSAVVSGNEIFLIGGLGQGASHFSLLDQVTAFQPSTGRWRELAKLPFATFAPAAGILGNEIFVFGGMFKYSEENYAYVNHIFSLKIESDNNIKQWHHTGRYLSETKGFAQVVEMASGTLGILGGHSSLPNGEDSPVATFETFQQR